ncbi:BRO family protein [Metapseudomonas boanensis]|uniref:Phage antirepressor n=1 Tax=Metapseudomonas boanensis TaxID=2822138 RepID=A0ABS5XJV6_9GAMM|nr:BRO family protein [Pseudomonas boanensis]MBT8767984.1 phage antirepressor [Pseudomonas boanensis]
MSDNQPWLAAYDFTRQLSLHHPQTLHRLLKPFETRRVPVRYTDGNEEVIHVINEAGLYKALIRFGHPEYHQLDEWPTREVIPTLRDQHAPDSELPHRVILSWQCQGLMLLEWQGERWMPWGQVPCHVDS